MRRLLATAAASCLALGLVACSSDAADTAEDAVTFSDGDNVVNLYTSRHYDVDKELYEMFREKTGLELNVVEGKSDELIERINREKAAPAADLLLTVGAESIAQLKNNDLIEETTSPTLESSIDPKYRGDDWVGLMARARVLAYNKDTVDPATLTTYESITAPEFKGKVLARSSSSSYNQALLASFIDLWGEEKATEWAQGVVDNFAREPKGNDIDQAKAVAAGEGDVAIMNSYYWARLANSSDPEDAKVTEKVGLVFPENTHMNLSYGALLKGAKHKENAIKFLEFMASPEVQEKIAKENGEFPLNPQVTLPEPQASWGKFTTQDLDFATFGNNKPEATIIFDKVGWK
ncbi:extracellular solute-binding protein [Corynebacterium choanae]|uniref:Iron deficiency-induced protein A n=1 Tax=Corynebacterium choanae TaxID=1862358 RepID=A0A3G6J440_9CORY|nr:extracellular solute-binding protein [Corynebacterium choanae]AZA12473.1 Iron deficiency-induced protein A precursor [Corynebacterium choanae]